MKGFNRRSSDDGESSFSLNVAPESLFHDEEIALTGVSLDNPLWDNGKGQNPLQDQLRDEKDEDYPLLPPTHNEDEDDMKDVMRNIMAMEAAQRRRVKQIEPWTWGQVCRSIAVAMALAVFILGIAALSFAQTSAVWASPGLIIEDDDNVGLSGSSTLCPSNFGSTVLLYQHSNESLCMDEFKTDCHCIDPVQAIEPVEKMFGDTSYEGVEDLDVVLLGDTWIENCARGLTTDSAQDENRKMERSGMEAVCYQLFQKENDSPVNGMAMGAKGDRTSNLHYRLKEDASILDSLDPKIWWIHIGANDVTEDNCSSDSIVSSILPLIDEITSRRPDARIVVNSIVSIQSTKGATMDEAHWRNVQQANDYLNCYAQEHQYFEFFDARAIFSTTGIDGIVSTSQMTAWGQAIVDRVLELSP